MDAGLEWKTKYDQDVRSGEAACEMYKLKDANYFA
jgi:hypothetical protein